MKAKRDWLIVAGMLAAAFLGGAFAQWAFSGGVTYAAEARPQFISAQGFVLVDADGNQRAVLGALPEGVGLVLKDEEGRERLVLGNVTMPHVPLQASWGLVVRDETGTDRCALGLADGAGMAAWDPQGTMRIAIGEGPAGVGIGLMDAEGNDRVGIGLGPGVSGGNFVAKDQFGNNVWQALGRVEPMP